MARLIKNLEAELREEERKHRVGCPSLRRDVADLLLKAANEIAMLQSELRRRDDGMYGTDN